MVSTLDKKKKKNHSPGRSYPLQFLSSLGNFPNCWQVTARFSQWKLPSSGGCYHGDFTLWFGNVYKTGGGGDQRSLFAHGRPQIEDSGGALSWKVNGQLGTAITWGPQTLFSKPPHPSLPQTHLPLPSLSHVSQMAVWCLPGCHLPHEGSDSLSCTEPGFRVCSSAYWSNRAAQKTQTTAQRRSHRFLFLRWRRLKGKLLCATTEGFVTTRKAHSQIHKAQGLPRRTRPAKTARCARTANSAERWLPVPQIDESSRSHRDSLSHFVLKCIILF